MQGVGYFYIILLDYTVSMYHFGVQSHMVTYLLLMLKVCSSQYIHRFRVGRYLFNSTLESFQEYAGSFPVTAIKSDLGNPGSLIIGYGHAVIIRKGDGSSDFLSGEYTTEGNDDGVYPHSRISSPICFMQTDSDTIVFLEPYCVKTLKKPLRNTTILAGNCHNMNLQSIQGSNFNDVRFPALKSCALGDGMTLWIVDEFNKVYTMALNLEIIGTPIHTSSENFYKMLLFNTDRSLAITMTADRRIVTVNRSGTVKHIAFKSNNAMSPALVDGPGYQAQIVTAANSIPTSFIDYYGELLITAEKASTVRLVDMKISNNTFVSSICEGIGTSSRHMGPIDRCGVGFMEAVYMGQTTQTLYIATDIYGVLKFDVPRDIDGCSRDADCPQFCDQFSNCWVTNYGLCDRVLRHCLFRCESDNSVCAQREKCQTAVDGPHSCLQSCTTSDNCPFSQSCFAGFCTIPERMPVWCLNDCTCLVVLILPNQGSNWTSSVDQCKALGNGYQLLTVPSAETLYTVQNLLKLFNLPNQRYFWTAAFTDSSGGPPKWRTSNGEQEISKDSPFVEMFDWTDISAVYYDTQDEMWIGTDNDELEANVICEVNSYSHPVDIGVILTDIGTYVDPFATNTKKCPGNEWMYIYHSRKLPGCRSMIWKQDDENFPPASSIKSVAIRFFELFEPISGRALRPGCCDFKRLPLTVQFTPKDTAITEGNATVFDCVRGHAAADGSLRTTGRCIDGEWDINECLYDADVSCSLGPGSIPFFGTLESSSRLSDNDLYQIGDIIVISCITEADNQYELHTFTCGDDGRWSPDIDQTLPEQCLLPVRTSDVSWSYEQGEGMCYGITAGEFTHIESEFLCKSKPYGELATITSAQVELFILDQLEATFRHADHSEEPALWTAGKFDGSELVDRNGNPLTYTGDISTETVSAAYNSCILLWDEGLELENCLDYNLAVCEISNLKPQDGWSTWESWTLCLRDKDRLRGRSQVLNRERRRYCLQNVTSGSCPVCDGDGLVVERCCPDPGFVGNALRGDLNQHIGSSVTYQCNYGYWIGRATSQTIQCRLDGQWSHTPEQCEAIACSFDDLDTPPDTNSYIWTGSLPRSRYTISSVVYRLCNDSGLVLMGDLVSLRYIRCLESGEWTDDSMKRCIPMQCGEAPSVQNGLLTKIVHGYEFDHRHDHNLHYSDMAHYKCADNYHYRLSEEFDVECLAGGRLSDPNPSCSEVFCDQPASSLPANTYIADHKARPGDKVHLTCDLSYAVNGNKDHTIQTVTCIGFSSWNLAGALPCGVLRCPDIDNGTNVYSIGGGETRLIGDKVVYLCPYGMFDSSRKLPLVERECQLNFTWSGDSVKCIDIYCEDPGINDNSKRVVGGFLYTDMITYRCDAGYIVWGTVDVVEVNMTCLVSSEWDIGPPSCVFSGPYHSMRIEEIKGNKVTYSLVQSQAYQGVDVTYSLIAQGRNRYGESANQTTIVTNSLSGFKMITIPAPYGFTFNTQVATSAVVTNMTTETRLTNPGSIYEYYIPTAEPSLIRGANYLNTKPILSGLPGQHFQSSVEATMLFPYTNDNGKIRKMAIIVCEVISYLPESYYDKRLDRLLPTYQQVQPTGVDDERSVWDCYQTTDDCLYDEPIGCGAFNLADGFIGAEGVIRRRTKIGTESCDSKNSDQYCNGYLKDISLFCVKLRVYTHDDYYDTPCSERIATAIAWEIGLGYALFLSLAPSFVMFILGYTLKKYTENWIYEERLASDDFTELPKCWKRQQLIEYGLVSAAHMADRDDYSLDEDPGFKTTPSLWSMIKSRTRALKEGDGSVTHTERSSSTRVRGKKRSNTSRISSVNTKTSKVSTALKTSKSEKDKKKLQVEDYKPDELTVSRKGWSISGTSEPTTNTAATAGQTMEDKTKTSRQPNTRGAAKTSITLLRDVKEKKENIKSTKPKAPAAVKKGQQKPQRSAAPTAVHAPRKVSSKASTASKTSAGFKARRIPSVTVYDDKIEEITAEKKEKERQKDFSAIKDKGKLAVKKS